MIAYQHNIKKIKQQEEEKTLPFKLKDVKLNQSLLKEIDVETAKKLIIEYEWVKTLPLFIKYCFGIYFKICDKEYLGGVIIYSEEYSSNKQNIWKKNNYSNKILLLSRGVSLWWTPKNTASYFISKTINWLKKNTKYKIITSTVDPAAGEVGVIYQSLNWYYVGLMNGNYTETGNETNVFSIYINGKLKSSRLLKKELGTINKEIILEKYPKAIFVPQYRKRRYFYFISNDKENKKLYDNIKNIILPYPKRNHNIVGIIYKITNLINDKIYIGQTTRSLLDRISEYERGVGCNPYILKAFNKYGWDNFDIKAIDVSENLNDLNQKEIYYIKKHKSSYRKYGYNIELGGRNSSASIETRKKLSDARKNIKQSPMWVKKRTDQISKKVVKIDKETNKILEEYKSLANAGKNNNDNLSYPQLNRLCIGTSKQKNNNIWCYKDDYINHTIPEYKSHPPKKTLSSFTTQELDNLYDKYCSGESIRSISLEQNMTFSTLQKFIKSKENISKSNIISNKTIAICKKTQKEFKDVINKSGALTNHILNTYHEMKLPSKYKRKQFEIETGKPWYYEYFDFK